MRFTNPARPTVVHKDLRENSLIELIQRDLSARRLIGGPAAAASYRLVARSTESPAARALGAVAADALALGIEIRAVFLKVSVSAGPDATSLPLAAASCRLISDPRVLDAHEQLVLSSRTAWIGDCMRRDPGKRDAYECYCENCESTAAWAARSFESLWGAASPVDLARAAKKSAGAPVHELIDASLLTSPDGSPDLATVRH
jgi:hypothetical protein